MKFLFNLKNFNLKKLLFVIMFMCSFSVFTQNTTYINLDSPKFIATYSLEYKEDSLNLDFIKSQEMWLLIGEKISYFVSKYYYLDSRTISRMKSRTELELWAANRVYTPRSLYHIYKNYPDGKITFIENNGGDLFKYEETLDEFDWELTQDTATIGGYLSQKASCNYGGRSWIAWFSTEIPFNDGPYKFNGLPGLIVEVYDSRKHYVFKLTSIEEPNPDVPITILEYAYFETTKEKYLRAREAMRNSLSSIVKQRGGDTNSQQVVAKVAASRNNNIELR